MTDTHWSTYFILTEGIFLQQVLITAAYFQDVFALVLLHTHFELLCRKQHTPGLFPNGFCYHLLRYTIMVDLECVLLLVIVRGDYYPNHHNDLTYKKKKNINRDDAQKTKAARYQINS